MQEHALYVMCHVIPFHCKACNLRNYEELGKHLWKVAVSLHTQVSCKLLHHKFKYGNQRKPKKWKIKEDKGLIIRGPMSLVFVSCSEVPRQHSEGLRTPERLPCFCPHWGIKISYA